MALLTKIKTRLAIHARRPVRGWLEGRNTSVFAGRSLDFADLRDYVPGDDVTDIAWSASARSGHLLVKRYVADRKHTVIVVVDSGREFAALSAWSPAGGEQATVAEIAITVAGVLGWIAVKHGDYVGVVCAGEQAPVMCRPSTREVDLERMLEQVAATSTVFGPRQDTRAILGHAVGLVRRRSIMFVVLGDIDIDAEIEATLRRLVAQHELVVITIADLDPTQPGPAAQVVDVGTGRSLPGFAARSTALAHDVAAQATERAQRREAVFSRTQITHLHLSDPARVIDDLLDLVERMERMRRAR